MAKVGGQDINVKLPLADYPTLLFFPRLGPPGLLVGRPRDRVDMRAMWMYSLNLNPQSLAKYGIQSMASAVMDTPRFSQMLAKIAHSYAAAVIGLDGFVPLLLDHILHPDGFPWHFVGGIENDEPPSGFLHEIGHEERELDGKIFLVVRVRLFANLGAPSYFIVTGELKSMNVAA
jgi:hypothetical protein